MQKQKYNKQTKINEIVGGYNKREKAIYSFNNENYRNGRLNISECRYTKYRGNRMCC